MVYRGKKAKTQYAPMPRRVTNDYRILKNPRMEYKVWDYDLTSQANSSTVGIFNLAAAGTTTAALTRGLSAYQNFQGNIVDVQSIALSYYIQGGVTTGGTTPDKMNISRIMVFQWNDDVAPAAATVLQSVTTHNSPLGPTYMDNRNDIVVLADIKEVTFPNCYDSTVSITNCTSTSVNGSRYIKGKKLSPVSFLSGAVTYQKGGLYVLIVSDSVATPHPFVDMYFRITFVE